MLLAYYIFCAIASFVVLGFYLYTKKKYTSSLYSILFTFIFFAQLGYLSLAMSIDKYEALLATKIIYLGGIFIPFVLVMIMSRFFNFKFHNYLCIIGATLALAMYGLIISIGSNDLYYKSFEYANTLGVGYLIKEYGPLHFISSIYSFSYIVIDICFIIYAYLKKQRISNGTITYFLVVVICTALNSIVSRPLRQIIDLVPISYVISEVLVLFAIRRMNHYDIGAEALDNLEKKEYYGCIAINKNYNFIGCNGKAIDVFPELEELYVDKVLPNNEFCNTLRKLIIKYQNRETEVFTHVSRNKKSYRFTVNSHTDGHHSCYFIEITDDTKQEKYINLLNNYSDELSAKVEEKTKHIKEIQGKIILGMADMIESRDELTGGHVKRTSNVVAIIVESLKKLNTYNMDNDFYDFVRRSAPMHDLGKITISNDILNKPGRFTPEEFEIMKTHSALGEKYVAALLEGIEDERFVTIAKNVARYHHEKMNGMGYPDGLKDDDIPIEARIMALADVYDALVSKRCYKESMSFEKASEIILESMGSHFDARLESVFLDCRDKLEEYYNSLN